MSKSVKKAEEAIPNSKRKSENVAAKVGTVQITDTGTDGQMSFSVKFKFSWDPLNEAESTAVWKRIAKLLHGSLEPDELAVAQKDLALAVDKYSAQFLPKAVQA